MGGDEFAILLGQSDADGAYMTIRRLLAAWLEGSTGYAIEAVRLVLGRHQRPARVRPSTARRMYRQADAALYWGKRHGRTCVTTYDPARHDGRRRRGRRPSSSAAVGQVAATGALRAVFQPIYDLTTGRRRAASRA